VYDEPDASVCVQEEPEVEHTIPAPEQTQAPPAGEAEALLLLQSFPAS
jgi:hypothetical protein